MIRTYSRWTNIDDQILKDYYQCGHNHIHTLMPYKTISSIKNRLYKLRLYTLTNQQQSKNGSSPRWSKQEVEFLKQNIYKLSYSEIATKLNKTVRSVNKKAQRLNIVSNITCLFDDEVNKRDREANAIPFEPYTSLYVKRKYQCSICQQPFYREPRQIWKIGTCICNTCNDRGRLSIEEVLLRDNTVGCIPIEPYVTNNTLRKYKCVDCSKIFKSAPWKIWSDKRTRCRICSYKKKNLSFEEVAEKANKVGAILIGPICGGKKLTVFECPQCHQYFRRRPRNVIDQLQILCLACSKKNVITKPTIQILKLIKKILNITDDDKYFLEQKIPHWKGAADILINDIVIEYDSYYWHRIFKDISDIEKRKNKVISKAGYKLLRIQSNGSDIPSEEQLRKVLLNDFQHGVKKKTITMKSWKEAKKKYKAGLAC